MRITLPQTKPICEREFTFFQYFVVDSVGGLAVGRRRFPVAVVQRLGSRPERVRLLRHVQEATRPSRILRRLPPRMRHYLPADFAQQILYGSAQFGRRRRRTRARAGAARRQPRVVARLGQFHVRTPGPSVRHVVRRRRYRVRRHALGVPVQVGPVIHIVCTSVRYGIHFNCVLSTLHSVARFARHHFPQFAELKQHINTCGFICIYIFMLFFRI